MIITSAIIEARKRRLLLLFYLSTVELHKHPDIPPEYAKP